MKSMTRTMSRVVAAGVLAITLSGCATLDMPNWDRHDFNRATDKVPAAEIVCVWKPAEGTGMDNLPTRGFAGQILFFNRHDSEPIVVDGDVRVYLFDDVGSVEEQSKPIHQFDFQAEAWNTHARMTTIGPSYHIFIPYTRKNNTYRTTCSLRIRMTAENGRAIFSDVIKVPLPGPEREGNRVTISDGTTLPGSIPGQVGSVAEQSANADFQHRKTKMQHLENLVRELKQTQQTPSRISRTSPRTFQPEQPHLLSETQDQQPASANSMTAAGHSSAVQFPLQQNPLALRAVPSNQLTESMNRNIHPLSGRVVSPQDVQPFPTQETHTLNPLTTSPMTQPSRSLSPHGTLQPQHPLNHAPATRQPTPQPNVHPLGQMHPLDGFSTQNSSSAPKPVLMPKVRANAAPSSQANAMNPQPAGNVSAGYQVSLLGR